MKKLVLIMSVLSIASFRAQAGNDGGGGGGFCVNGGKCITLAEAGFRIQEDSTLDAPIISSKVFDEVKTIMNSLLINLYMNGFITNLSIGEPSTYKKVLTYNEEVLKKIKLEYEQILDSHNQPSENLVIYALSDRKNTYLLPAFHQLNTRSQALILIHEGFVRYSGSVLHALKLDGAILDTLNGNDKRDNIVMIVTNPKMDFEYGFDATEMIVGDHVEKFYKQYGDYLKLENFALPSCLSAASDVSLYENHPRVWKTMKYYDQSCITTRAIGNVNLPERASICKKIGTGSILKGFSYSHTEVIKCSNKKYVHSYRLAFD